MSDQHELYIVKYEAGEIEQRLRELLELLESIRDLARTDLPIEGTTQAEYDKMRLWKIARMANEALEGDE